jgi:hypothetical protein
VEALGKIKEEGSMGRDALHAKYGDAAPYLYAWEEAQSLVSTALAAAKGEL